MEALLDFTKPFNPALLDQAIAVMYSADSAQAQVRTQVDRLLVSFQEHPQSWTRVVAILEQCKNPNSMIFALNVLIKTVKTRWNILPDAQQQAIKNYVVQKIIKISQDPVQLKAMKPLISKFNLALVQIVKQDWPERWPNFISELVASSKNSESLCANNMSIFLLLSEEVFDFSQETMTQTKMKAMKQNLNKEFKNIYTLLDYILREARDVNLLTTTLRTLLRFLAWIPLGYIFETTLIQMLIFKFFPVREFQNDTLKCLAEIASIQLTGSNHDAKLESLFVELVKQVASLLSPETDVAKVYQTGDENTTTFVNYLALFLTSFLKAHLPLLERGNEQTAAALRSALGFLLRLSRVEDTKIFKMCLEYWNILVAELYASRTPSESVMMGKPKQSQRTLRYQEILSQLRHVMIAKMAKPEEVLVVVDHSGDVIREQLKDGAAIVLYKEMRDCLIFLTHLDPEDAQDTMLSKLSRQVDGSEFSWHNLNRLCWAIGSISGSLSDITEKTFLVRVIKDLLGLCEAKSGKDHKAVIASNIMYVVGQYPRFLKQHWRFLKTVVNKLFEFMHEKHPGVQDMSCDTFLKIAKQCKRKFVVDQPDEKRPFIDEILEKLPITTRDLEQSQIHTFYEAVAHIIGSESDQAKRQQYVQKLMQLPNQSWVLIISAAQRDKNTLWEPATIKQVIVVLKANCRVAQSLKEHFVVQLGRIYIEVLSIYTFYSEFVSAKIEADGPRVCDTMGIRLMRMVKKEALKLVEAFVEGCGPKDREMLMTKILPPLVDRVLEDYKRNVPAARDEEVLGLFATIITNLESHVISYVPRIFEKTFQCTLDMINKNYIDFPDHRLTFFQLLKAIEQHAFPALLRFSPEQFKLIMVSIVWALKHLEKNVADTGLDILANLLKQINTSEVANQFYKTFYTTMVHDLLKVLTDTMHKPGLTKQTEILSSLFALVESGKLTVPLYENGQYPNNKAFIRQFVANLLGSTFKNLTQNQVLQVVTSLFASCNDANLFKQCFRDFLVQLKEFSKDMVELYSDERRTQVEQAKAAEEQRVRAVPGLLYEGPSASVLQQQHAVQAAHSAMVAQVLGSR